MPVKKRNRSYFSIPERIEYWSDVYDRGDFRAACYASRMDVALRWLDDLALPPEAAVLDAGCGPGRVAREVIQRGYSVYGLDYSHGMLQSARQTAGQNGVTLNLVEGDVEFLPIEDCSIDFIICLGVISYVPSVDSTFSEVARVMKPGGVFVVSFVNRARAVGHLDVPRRMIERFRRMLNRLGVWRTRDQIQAPPAIKTALLISEVQAALRRAGLQPVDYQTVPYEALTFMGRGIYPRKFAMAATLFFERFRRIPVVGSFGGMCVIKAEKQKAG